MGDLSSDPWVSLYEKIVVTLTVPEQRAERWETECQDPGSLRGSKSDQIPRGERPFLKWSAADIVPVDLCSYGDTLRIQVATTNAGVRRKGPLTQGPYRASGTHREVTLLCFVRSAQSQPGVNPGFLLLLLEFHGYDILFLGEIDIQIGKQTQMLRSFSEMLHQHHKAGCVPSRGRGHV